MNGDSNRHRLLSGCAMFVAFPATLLQIIICAGACGPPSRAEDYGHLYTPFVGLFIARVSKGRTVREFIDGGIAGIHIEDQLFPKRAHYHKYVAHAVPIAHTVILYLLGLNHEQLTVYQKAIHFVSSRTSPDLVRCLEYLARDACFLEAKSTTKACQASANDVYLRIRQADDSCSAFYSQVPTGAGRNPAVRDRIYRDTVSPGLSGQCSRCSYNGSCQRWGAPVPTRGRSDRNTT